jgi:hypothetical protein
VCLCVCSLLQLSYLLRRSRAPLHISVIGEGDCDLSRFKGNKAQFGLVNLFIWKVCFIQLCGKKMAIFLEGLVVPTFILARLYLVITLYGCRRLRSLHRQTTQLNTRKVFVMSCLLSTFLRFLSFGTMSGLNFFDYNVESHNASGKNDIKTFYDKAGLVMFDLPDFCFVSAYILLLVVWAEAILASRKHWISTTSYRQRSLLVYLIFNIVLYTVQVVLYMFLFVPSIDQV